MKFTNKLMVKYVRDRKNQPMGVVVAFPENGQICYGWSLCNRKSGDRFIKDFGVGLAIDRAVPVKELVRQSLNGEIAHTVARDLSKMIDRSERYFFKNVRDFNAIQRAGR